MATDATHTDVKDAGGVIKTLNDRQIGRLAVGQGAATALCTEDKAALDLLHTDLGAIGGYVDGLEGFTDNLETLLGLTNTKLDAVNGNVDGLETLITSGNALLTDLRTAAQDASDVGVSPHQPCKSVTYTPVLPTAIMAAGNVLFATAPLTLSRTVDLEAILQGIKVIDKSKQNPAFSMFFYQANVTSAAVNAANNLSDADALSYLGHVSFLAADYKALANNSFCCYSGAKAPNLMLTPLPTTTTVYTVGVLDAGTPTFALGDLTIKLDMLQR